MKLNIIRQDPDFEALKIFVDLHFGKDMRYIQQEMSIFPQWIMRPVERIWIPEIWKYRIVQNNGQFVFGTI